MNPFSEDYRRAAFRVLIDYVQAFAEDQQHTGMLFWRPDGSPRKGTHYTDLALSHLLDHTFQVGLLTDDQHNEWTPELWSAALQRFATHFTVTQTHDKNLTPDAEPECCGTARATLQHKTLAEFTLILRFVKKAALPPQDHIFLVDDEGHSIKAKACKTIKIFTLAFVTNTLPMEPWVATPKAQRAPRKRKTPMATDSTATPNLALPPARRRALVLDDHDERIQEITSE